MRLLIITQKINVNDDVLGFMHGWITEFAKHFESIIVIALGVGEYHLPNNVKVLSLGKENLEFGIWNLEFLKKLKYSFNFFKHIIAERKNYDSVFIHMNKEYMLLGGLLWRVFGKKTALWYNHKKGNIISNLAGYLASQIFYTSPFSFFAKWKKAQIMPVGIDTDFFKPDLSVKKTSNSILFLGRLSPVKKPEIFIEALGLLKNEGVNFEASLIGDAPERDRQYGEKIKQRIKELKLTDCVNIRKGVPNWQTPLIYNQHEIFVNLTSSGSMDKTIFEAMACGCLVLMSNASLARELDDCLFFSDNDSVNLAGTIKSGMFLDGVNKRRIIFASQDFVVKKHSLVVLAGRLTEFL